MDCGPASLKCLLEGFGTHVSYGRLREACQTGIDGTSIDTMEEVANQLGLEAEQIMIPADHLLLRGAKALPAIAVVTLPNGLTHFVVVWRRHGRMVQVMDPAIGRRWVTAEQLAAEIYHHPMPVEADGWREFAASDNFQAALVERFGNLGIARSRAERLTGQALSDESWRGLAALDAAVRLMRSLVQAGAVQRGRDAEDLIERLCASPELIPLRYWSVQPSDDGGADGSEQVIMRGAVLMRIRSKRDAPAPEALAPELAAAVAERPLSAGRELVRLLWESGASASVFLVLALAAAAGAVVIEALLFRGLFDIAGQLGLAGQRLSAIAAVLLFSFIVLLLEVSSFTGAMRLGRQMENRLRMAFLAKIPKLGDRYFQSRLTSDMAERSHSTHRLRRLPDLARQLLRAVFELCATAVAIVWLLPAATPWVLLTVGAALLIPFLAQPALAERDSRVRNHAAGLTRFYLDAMLGLMAIRAHRAERSVRREHEKLLGEWAHAAFRLQRTVVAAEAVQLAATFGLVVCLLLAHPLNGGDIGRVLLVVYWALSLPSIGQEIGALARQYPYSRNLTLRVLDPLGAPEEEISETSATNSEPLAQAPRIEFRDVGVGASGHTILEDVSVDIEPGSHVAIVGPSGAGKSSLVGILLGWLKPSGGEVLVNGGPLDVDLMRRSLAWVDPAVQIWNRSLFSNLTYGSNAGEAATAKAVDAASLQNVLESLPQGLETKLGEGGGLVSGGEGQRVRLGRALLRNPAPLVILDEPFRGLDREKRRELLERARAFWRDSTMLCITHDIAETRGFDRVLVVEAGHVIEDGTPQELSSRGGSRYAELLRAEEEARSEMWSGAIWRRIRIHSGRIVEEESPRPLANVRPETEVA